MTEKIAIKNLADMPEAVRKLLKLLSLKGEIHGAVVVGLSGDLGAGKTTLVQQLALELGVKDRVQSPTFTILKLYQTNHSEFKQLIHMDAYRIESLSELEPLRFQELLKMPATLLCVEWPEKIAEALPTHALVKFKTISEDERELTITKVDK